MICCKCELLKMRKNLLKMSLVPPVCQESQINADDCTHSESIEWLLDLKDKTPIWSRLLDINTSAFKRKLPLSMTKNYDIEIEGRLWSLWGTERKLRKQHHLSKSYMAVSIMALCAARVLRLNAWSSTLMDIIRHNGRKYFKESLKKAQCNCKNFQLKHLDKECSLEGIHFQIHLKPVQKGRLFGTPLKCQPNLAFALIHFFDHYQFGILECCNRLISFGFIDGPQGGYFLFDAQNKSDYLFTKKFAAPYLLRTNHLQILLYCLVVALNVCHLNAQFCLYHIEIAVKKPFESKTSIKSTESFNVHYPRIIPSELWKIPENECSASESSTSENLIKCQNKDNENKTEQESLLKPKYRRKLHNIKKEEVEKSIIKPLVDADQQSDEDLQLKKDFVRMICSGTLLPQTTEDSGNKMVKDFSCNLLDALLMGPETCLRLKDL